MIDQERLTQFDRLPLSFAQERLWFLNELEPGSAVYNVPGAVIIRGALDVRHVEQALNFVIARHESLRTVFPSEEGRPYQRILDGADFELERIDLSYLETSEARDNEARERCRADAARPFDLANGPLLRGIVMKLSGREHILMLNMHHIISDGWSTAVLVKELRVALEAFRQGRDPELPPLPIQYADYSVWQRQWLEEEGILAEQLAYWQAKLAGAPESLALASDFPRPDVQTYAGASHGFVLDAQLTGQLKRIAEQHGGTLFMVLLAAFKVLLHRYTGQNDLCVGTPIANRQYGETEGLIGLFINTLALRTRVEGSDTFAGLLAKVKATCLEAYENQDAPFEKVVDVLRLQRNLASSPLFQVMLILQNTESVAIDDSMEPYPLDGGISKFDLTIELVESAEGLTGSIRYRTALYEARTIARVAGHFAALLRALIASPAVPIHGLDYLGAAEKQQLLTAFNNAPAEDGVKGKCLHDLFAEQVARCGDRTAVVCGAERLTYQQLDERSRELALVLQSEGVGPDTLVGLCVGRSLDMVVGLLGILQAGGAYVPLDPDYPDDRIAYMVRDSRAAIVLTQAALQDRLRGLIPPETRLLALDREWPEVAARAAALCGEQVRLERVESRRVEPQHLAYVIYTSGSTGRPKGVMVEHGHVVRYATAVRDRLQIPDGASFALVSTFAADLGNTVLFPSLLNGGTLHVLSAEAATDAEVYASYCRSHRIDCMKVTASHLQALVGERTDPALIPAHTLVLGGELLSPGVVRWIREINPACRVFNHYGPTECTVGVLCGEAPSSSPRSVPLGSPLGGTRIYIVDGQGQPVPVGVAGELLIGGVQVARGYLNRPELTAERFIADRFSAESGARVYKTGDMARWRADGTVEYLGRNDFQVKIRGFRIEPGEIDAQLLKHAAVREAVVIDREDDPGDKRLVAYVTLAEPAGVDELRAHLLARVPQYMVPSAFVILDALPLTLNGKVDRRALPRPEVQAYASKPYEPPQGRVEEELAAVWEELLHVERVGRSDNFFELGGHSLLATRLISKIRSRLGVDLPLKALFEAGTVAELAGSLVRAESNDIPPILPADRTQYDPLPLSFAQERLWFLSQLAPETASYNLPRPVTIRGAVDIAQIEGAFNFIIARHENLRTVFPSEEGQARQRILEAVDFKLRRIDLSGWDGELRDAEAKRLCQLDAATPFDLATGPLIRGMVIKLAEDEHILMLNLHHIISDGWSTGVLIRELGAVMAALSEGRRPELPPLPVQYADYSVWQRRWLEESGVLERQLGYWQRQLAGAPESLDLPTDFPRPSVQTYAGARHLFPLDARLTGRLEQLAEQQGSTLYMVLLAALEVLLYRYTGQNDLCVGTPIANRQYGETEALIGMFVNTLAMRSRVEGSDSFAALLAKVKTTCLEAYEHQDAPFEKVVDSLDLQRNLATTPLFQVMLILQNTERAAFDASIQPYPLDGSVSKFDLTLELSSTAEGLAALFEYNTDLYKAETIARMAGHFTALCEAITAAPTAAVCELDYLGEAEKHALLAGYNDTAADYPKDLCLHELFTEQAALSGEKTAVVCGDERLTYRQLDERSRDLALVLQSQGVGPDSLVGVCMERSLDMVVSLLGILRAGGAYVPLDPEYPSERLAYMLRDSGAAIVLTQESLVEKLGGLVEAGTQMIAVDRQWPAMADRTLQQHVRPHHLAYVIYTSGSTGNPKGVAIEHHSPVTLVQWGLEVYSSEDLSGVLASTSICFDLSVYEIFLTLAAGGTIIVVRNAMALADGLGQNGITLINTVPSAMEELVRLGAVPESVRTINLAGEPLTARLVDRIYETTAAGKVYDLYGPSEDTTYSTYVLRTQNGPQTIGRPIANTQVYILDARNQLQPIGVPGELHIAGDGLARGYLNRPELTDEKFVANPFEPGTRMYRTGDLARWQDDGTLQYLGRIDTQVKVRGFRIEMGEIEARLQQHAGIQDVAVIAQGQGVERQLVAFYRAKETTSDQLVQLPAEELRAHLLQTLPDYMVPAVFVSLVAIPLSPNGKVDRRALAGMDVTAAASREYVAPRNETERQLVAIWAGILNLAAERIGIHDNFFELGGHSLLATRLISRIRSRFNVDLPLKALFEGGSVAQLADRIAKAERHAVPAAVPIDRTQKDRRLLSFAQERLWFLNQLAPNTAGYNIFGAIRIHSALDVGLVEEAFHFIIARHEILRTVFPSEEGQAWQKILEAIELKLQRIDLSSWDREIREAEAKRLCQLDAAKPFDLATGPLMRGLVIRLADDDHILMLSLHHIISDGWSNAVLIRELGEVMVALDEGRRPELPPLPIQYADYSVWQRRWLEEGGALERQLGYWQQKLAGAPESLDLPTDFPRPSVQTYAGASHPFSLDARLAGQLKSLAEQHGGTLYMVLLAAFKVLLYRYTGQTDLCVGTPIANRRHGETEGLIGMFVNTLAMRSQVEGRDSFAALLAKVKTTCLEAYEHQDAPFEKVVDALHVQRNLATTPLFQVMLVLQNTEAVAVDASMESYPLETCVSKFDLTVTFSETPHGLEALLDYNTALYKAETVARMAGHFTALCEAITAAPTAAVGELDYLGEAEKQVLLARYNDTAADYSLDQCIHHLFDEQVARNPAKTAVVCGGEQLTYQELLSRSRDLALYLQSEGVRPDSLVGVCMERSLEMVVALFGILEAGGAYVPLDPDYPDERLAHMVRDSRAAIVLTQERLREKLVPLVAAGTQVVALDAQGPEIGKRVSALKGAGVALRQEVEPHHLAYVIYTSGSTGLPKGVMNEHRGVVNRLLWMQDAYGLGEEDAVLQKTPFSFDVSVWEFFWTLSTGATLVMARPEGHKDPAYLTDTIVRHGITTLHFVPPMLQVFLEHAEARQCLSLERVVCSGEALPSALVQRFAERLPHAVLYNLYGPTEAAVDVTEWTCPATDVPEAIPIGRPIANTQIYVLDGHGAPVPVGVAGELHIAGVQVARGYLNRPKLTAERFVADPFAAQAGARMYKTGDLARWQDDGTLQYLGRIDTQVKVRGFRIEMGEIEARLHQHLGIEDAVVIAQGQGVERQLVAFYRAKETTSEQLVQLPAEELRAHLLQTLPDYMVPAAFVSLAAIPLSPNGKVDRRALAGMDVTAAASREYAAPRNETESQLVAIWADILNLAAERIGIHDNFFELGGHSLLATRLISKIRNRFTVDLPLKALFEGGSVAQLADRIAKAERQAGLAIVPIDRTQYDRLPLSFAQERLWFLNQLAPDTAGYNIPGAIRIRGAADIGQVEEAFHFIIARHETLRTVFPSEEGQARQKILEAVDFKLRRIDLSGWDGEIRDAEAKRLCQSEAATPFDLATGPLIRGMVIRLAEDDHILMLTLHHIISDGWSHGVLIRELGAVMAALSEGRRPELAPLPIQYADYSVWQRRWLKEEGALERQLGYWQQQLAGVPESLDLPTDHPRPSVQSFEGTSHAVSLDAQLTARLKGIAEEQGGTLFMVLLAAFQALLHRYTGQGDICVGSPIANRQYGETEGLIGMFVNTLALRTRVESDDSFADLFARVKTTCLEAYEHQDAPFEKIVDVLQLRRDLAINPLFQVMLVLQNADPGFVADDRIRPFPLDNGISKFDLTLTLTETPDGLAGSLQYRTALFEKQTIDRMAGHFLAVCRAITATPAARVSELEVLDEAERRQLLVDFNETRAEYRDSCLHELLAEQAAIRPEQPAVVFGEQELTYEELHRKSCQLASYLRSKGVQADSRVGLYTGRSLEMVVGLFGILQAGGAYVPLDPDYPAERLEYMLEDAAPTIVLTQQALLERLPSVPAIALDAEWSVIEASSGDGVPVETSPDQLAYVIYTSGSTGTPKGVMVRQGGVVNLREALERAVYAGHDDWTRVSVNASFSFDSSVKQFVQVLSGRTLVLIPQDVRLDATALLRYIGDQRIDVLDCTPSQLVALVSEGLFDGTRPIPKAFLVGGEAIDAALWRRLAERSDAAFYNVYGPAECTVDATVARITTEKPLPHIGRPVANAQIYILDGGGKPVPIGVVGEICIGGAGVARGYWNRPELTAERFVADPFSGDAEARLYKTGDLGRWRADGTIQYAGRNDHQVKLRGQRIELGEIESRLLSHARVREAVVMAREDEPGEKRLVAYVTTAGEAVGAEELRAHLGALLPQSMVPAAFVELEALPLTPNRKVDRKALPRPEAQAYASKAYEPPQGRVEEELAVVWQELLHVERVGRNDDFFELGGHSLLATRLISKIRTRLGVDLPLKALFEGGTVAQLARSIARVQTNDIPPILPADRTQYDHLPLSFAQERLWFLSQLAPNTAGYNIPRAVTIRGPLDVARVEDAFTYVIARHENLRTVFPSEEGQAWQKIVEDFDFKLTRIDLSGYDREWSDAEARRLCQSEAATPFDLAAGPLVRGMVIKLAEDEHILMLNLHHIISDGWSNAVLIRELSAVMAASSEGRRPELPPLPIQYADYSVWQRRWLEEGGALERQLGYWQRQLAGAPESLDLPTDFPRPSVQTYAGASYPFSLDARLTGQLRHLAVQHGGTLYMVLLAALETLLYRYTGQNDLCVGTPIANRQHGETEGLIGMFVNTLAMRNRVEGSDSFAALLAKVKTTCLEAYEHQDAPFEKVVDALHVQRNLATTPLFQVLLILQNAERAEINASMQPYPLNGGGISKFDLTVAFSETPDGLEALIEYNTALYKAETIARMAGHFAALCEAFTAAPTAELGKLDYLGEAEKHALLAGYNDTAADYPKDLCLHELFAEQAALSGEKTAVVCGDERLTYRQLDERSRDLALVLQSQGVGPDSLVGVCMERSLDMVVSLLGILRAGGAYVPLDPEYPSERLAYMLRDSGAAIVLTQESLVEKLGGLVAVGTQLIALDRQLPGTADRVLQQHVRPHHLAYVIYTSGSTGQPKGVAIEHHSPVTLVQWGLEVYSSEELAGVLASTSICFDLSVYEIFLTLASGGTIILVRNAMALAEGLGPDGITLINTVPSAMEELVRLGAVPESVRTINLAGEPLTARLVDRIYETTAAGKVYDLYGPSEDTTYSTYVLRTKNGPQTIGRPIANTQVYILDARNQLQPIGVPGELHIAGDGLARGYLNRPELTDEKFVANPFEPGTRMYRTGDLARWQDDGTLQYLGRIDTQVKVRGFRIEMGEIEARLQQHAGIQDAAVIAQGEGANKQLIAFYRAKETTADGIIELPGEELRDHLLRTLPSYMVPAVFVSVAAIPLNPNGKVDRRALARMDVTMASAREYVAPRNDTERRLVSIWAEVLNRDPETVGVHDNFFELGGHSLTAVQLMAKANADFQQMLPLAVLFTASDVAALANLISREEAPPFEILVPIQPHGDAPPVFAVPGAGGNVLSLRPLGQSLGDRQPLFAFQAVGLDGKTPPLASVEETARINIAAMKTAQPTGPYRLVGHSYGGVVAYEMTRILLEQGEEVSSLTLLDSLAPSVMQGNPVHDEVSDLVEACRAVADLNGAMPEIDVEALRRSTFEEIIRSLAGLLNDRGVAISTEQLTTFYGVYRANLLCYRAYTPSLLPRTIDVSLYRATQGRPERQDLPHDYGWDELLPSPIRAADVAADHFSIMELSRVRPGNST